MDKTLENICASIGWNQLYQEAFEIADKNLGSENGRGERRAQSPFPFSEDNNPSFSVNVKTGLWRDWHAGNLYGVEGGNYLQFCALMRADVDEDGKARPDYRETERMLRLRFNLGRPINATWFKECQLALEDPECEGHLLWMNARKRWTRQSLIDLGIGYDKDSGRLLIPCYYRKGNLVNARMYMPGAISPNPKMRWMQTGLSGNYIFPYEARMEEWVILCEGEPDAITLRSLGYNGISGTLGAGNPVPEVESLWFMGRDVYVWMDADGPGQEAAANAISVLQGVAKTIIRVDMPKWNDMPDNADVSDWVGHMFDMGFDDTQVQRAMTEHMQKSKVQCSVVSRYDVLPIKTPFATALTAKNINKKVGFIAHVMARGNDRFKMPILVDAKCPGRGHSYCSSCAMHTRFKSDAQLTIEPRAEICLSLIQTDKERQYGAIRQHFGINAACPDLRLETLDSIDIDTVLLTSTMDEEAENREDDNIERPRREAYILSYKGVHLTDTTDYYMEGYIYAMPKSQKIVFVIDSARAVASRYDKMQITEEMIGVMMIFQSDSPWNKIQEVSKDVSASTTLIVNRLDLHMVYRTVWHSVISFMFMDSIVEHGWIEALVIGDTRCGKSATFKRMSRLLGTGELVDCKMQTAPGILGAVETSTLTGERYIVPGILPRQDRRGPVAFDEFSSSRDSRSSMMDSLSSTRTEGKVKIVKAASAEFWARVRQIYMANPGRGKLMKDIGGFGVETILGLIEQPEDIARFDIAMIVTQDDVTVEELNSIIKPQPPKYSKEAHRLLLQWTWSRRPEQILWASGADEAVLGLSKAMYRKYDQTIPLVEPADQRMRIARIAVSIAAQCFSTDSTYENIVVQPEHVAAAAKLFCMCYDKAVMGYDKYSIRIQLDSTIVNENAIEKMMATRFGSSVLLMIDKLLVCQDFTLQSFQLMAPMNTIDVSNTIQILSINRCISKVRSKRGEHYELTSQFVKYLKDYRHRKEEQLDETRTP